MDKDEILDYLKDTGNKIVEQSKKIKDVKVQRGDMHAFFEKLQANGGVLIFTVMAAVIAMFFFCAVVFFINVKGPEEVMVPEVKGKVLTDALIEMQAKELYPKITLRYSDVPGDEGTILDQSPDAGAIVKGYSRVSLVVSRGVVVDKVEKYIGQNIDDIRMKLNTLFAGSSKPLIVLADPQYKADATPAGTVIEQDPPEETDISEPITLRLIVSKGPNYENTRIPQLMGASVNDMLQLIARSRLIFDFTSHYAQKSETEGTVVSQQSFSEDMVPNYTRVKVEFAFPRGEMNDNVYGIFSSTLSDYPYPVPMRLDCTTPQGETYTIVSFNHIGGKLSVPYAVPKGSTLTLYVVDKANKKITVK